MAIMTDAAEDGAEATDTGEAKDEEREGASRSQRFGDGVKQGIGVLSAFKDALEETIQEARDRGDLSAERAREVMKGALDRAQTAAEGARGRLDFVQQAQMDDVRAVLEALSTRVTELERAVFGDAAVESTGGPEQESDTAEDGKPGDEA
jgi:polyhydroxyalkanoate synthesis regulator phasin